MKKTKLTNEISNLDFSCDSFPWLNILDATAWKLGEINKLKNCHKLNYSIIINMTAVIEGYINHLMEIVLESRTNTIYTEAELDEIIEENLQEPERDEFIDRLTESINLELEQASWARYNTLFKIIFGKEMKMTVHNSTWKAINALFTFRHMIVHGKILTVEYNWTGVDNEYAINVHNKYKSVYAYLSEKGIVHVSLTGHVDLMSIEIVNHFYSMMKSFIKEIIDSISDKKEIDSLLEIFNLDKNLREILRQ